ncbi:hypothetical protein D3C87_1269080 [compost metagenome]
MGKDIGNETRTDRRECRRKRPDRLSLGDRDGRATKDQHAGQGDNERRHAPNRHPVTLRCTNQRTCRQADHRYGEEVQSILNHQHGGQRADHADHRTDREVDVAADDHHQHAQRHDHDVAVLQQQVGQVEWLHQRPAGGHLEEHHDDDQRGQKTVFTRAALE